MKKITIRISFNHFGDLVNFLSCMEFEDGGTYYSRTSQSILMQVLRKLSLRLFNLKSSNYNSNKLINIDLEYYQAYYLMKFLVYCLGREDLKPDVYKQNALRMLVNQLHEKLA